MPSSTEKQARFMAALSHGWHPSGIKHAPSQAVASEFNRADQGSTLLSNAMKHQHKAFGGSAIRQSPLESIASEKIGSGHMPHVARMPRVPIADTMRNVNAKVQGAKVKLPKLMRAVGGRVRPKHFDEGGKVALGLRAISVLKDALSHLANKDVSSAAAALRASPQAMAHPDVAAAAGALRSSAGIAPATRSLTNLVNADTDRSIMPTMGGQRRGGAIHRSRTTR